MDTGRSQRTKLTGFVATAVAAALVSCLPLQQKTGDLPMAEHRAIFGDGDVMGAFTGGFHTFARINCVGCHGVNQDPRFAVEDPVAAYQAARPYVDMTDLSSSDFIRKTNDGHCGSPCMGNSQTMMGNLTLWKASEDAAASGGGSGGGGGTPVPGAPPPLPKPTFVPIVSNEISLPATLPTGTTYTTIQVPLGNLIANSVMQLEVQRFAAANNAANPPIPGAFKIRRPRLGTSVNPIYLKNIRVKINGVEALYANDFADIDTAVANGAAIPNAPTTIPYPVLTVNDMLLIEDLGGSQPNKIQLLFEKFQVTTAVTCKDVTTFTNTVRPIMANRCYGCHQNTGNTGYQRFNMGTAAAPLTAAEHCARSLQRVVKNNPSASPLISNPLNRSNGHPGTAFIASEADTFISWIQKEQ